MVGNVMHLFTLGSLWTSMTVLAIPGCTFIGCCKLLLQLLMQGLLILQLSLTLCQLGIATGKLVIPAVQQLHIVLEVAFQLYVAVAEPLQLFTSLFSLH